MQDSIALAGGIGPKRAAALHKRNIDTFVDALLHLPYRYIDLRQRQNVADLRAEMDAVVAGRLEGLNLRPRRYSNFHSASSARLVDAAKRSIKVVWFNLPSYTQFPVGEPVLLCGRVTVGKDGTLQLSHPEVHRLAGGEVPPIRPVYSLPKEVPQRSFFSAVSEILAKLQNDNAGTPMDAMPVELIRTSGTLPVAEALRYLHRPPLDASIEQLESADTPAHQALALDEMFAFQLALCRDRARTRRRKGAAMTGPARLTDEFIASLPFVPTGAQVRAIDEIGNDLAGPTQMNRLLIGDVGSGKTMVAFWAALRAAESGYQTAIMAPTELLAEQHYRTFERLCGRLGLLSALLTGRVTGNERARNLRAIDRGDFTVVFGTQALIQEGVRMHNLGLAVIDEQHRFGVFDRARLIALGSEANVMLMTATPIPRSLAQTLFRNLEVSALDEMPPGRTPIATQIFHETAMPEVDAIVRTEIAKGNRAYYVLPLIDGAGDDDADDERKSVLAMAKHLNVSLKGCRVGTLHGRMHAAEKDRAMREFRDGLLDVLVSTTVVEVGIDVPEATVMVIVAAERYGLAQLHQLRGRVGRGAASSRCCLIVSNGAGDVALERLAVLARSRSGADVAQADLRLRGPGDLFGARQTGALPLRFARFIRDWRMVETAGELAERWLDQDPKMESDASAGARAALARILDSGFSLGDIG
ncbi:MAG: ATP-dependent helicase RecG [Candidatus Binataceae bacterium]|nr:ATP-dependent helicase RecG [Candidatus Binataceae bacterium]